MKPFNISIRAGEKPVVLTVNFLNGVYQIIYKSKILCALRPPGEDWQLLSMEEILAALPVYESDLLRPQEADLILHDPLIVQISGAIENHIRQFPV